MNFLLHISILDKPGKRMNIWPKYNIHNSNFHDTKLAIRIAKYCDFYTSVFFQVSDYVDYRDLASYSQALPETKSMSLL